MLEDRMIEVRNVSYSYNGKVALENVTFSSGDAFLAIMGPNGSGKTTLIKLIMGLLEQQKGEIKVFDMSPKEARHLIGYMPQRDAIAKHIPIQVKDIVLMGIAAKKFYSKEDIERAKEALEEIDSLHLWNEKFSSLSQGQQQRVLFARALAKNPKMIILDEPFNAVDLPSREKMVEVLKKKREEGVAIVAVVHNINPILHEIDEILLLNKKAIAFGTPKEVLNQENLRKAYGTDVQMIVCEEGYCHPLIGDEHAG
ncbi:MAG TPA: metal ABC transporter ATP-binding protein [Thermoplasmatales archaeon]|nr:metal ABC transporter ATP-binding protein [Thermoplasmatales archaeon]